VQQRAQLENRSREIRLVLHGGAEGRLRLRGPAEARQRQSQIESENRLKRRRQNRLVEQSGGFGKTALIHSQSARDVQQIWVGRQSAAEKRRQRELGGYQIAALQGIRRHRQHMLDGGRRGRHDHHPTL
jgi:hypothetical protein